MSDELRKSVIEFVFKHAKQDLTVAEANKIVDRIIEIMSDQKEPVAQPPSPTRPTFQPPHNWPPIAKQPTLEELSNKARQFRLGLPQVDNFSTVEQLWQVANFGCVSQIKPSWSGPYGYHTVGPTTY